MDYKVLVNKSNHVTKQFLNNVKLIVVKNYLGEDIFIERKTYEKFCALKDELKNDEIDIFIKSAYDDADIFSEHSTGICLDFVIQKEGDFLTNEEDIFTNIDMFEKVFKYLSKYGFILRYPKFMEKVTFNSYKPWHIRYVGFKTASIMVKEKLTLEEYHQKYDVSGVLIVNKPVGLTSREVDSLIGRKFDTKKVGHTGTLDPLASGVLIVLLNKATKICEDIVCNDKEYIAIVKRGVRTDTLDITGKILETSEIKKDVNLVKVLKSFEKSYLQEVPIYSAVKVDGMKLYQYARSGKNVDLPKKMVSIKKMELLEETGDSFKFKCLVSKGTYIRSLIRDIGVLIGECMTMQELIRIREANFMIDDSFSIEDITNDNYEIVPIDKVLNYTVIDISDDLFVKVKNGVKIPNIYEIDNKVIFKSKGEVVSIYEVDTDKSFLRCYKNFC